MALKRLTGCNRAHVDNQDLPQLGEIERRPSSILAKYRNAIIRQTLHINCGIKPSGCCKPLQITPEAKVASSLRPTCRLRKSLVGPFTIDGDCRLWYERLCGCWHSGSCYLWLRGDLFLARVLRCQSILCVSEYLSLAAWSSSRSRNHATTTTTASPLLSHSSLFSVTPALLFVSGFVSLFVIFYKSVYPAREVTLGVSGLLASLISLFCLLSSPPHTPSAPPSSLRLEAFNHETTTIVGLHENSARAC